VIVAILSILAYFCGVNTMEADGQLDPVMAWNDHDAGRGSAKTKGAKEQGKTAEVKVAARNRGNPAANAFWRKEAAEERTSTAMLAEAEVRQTVNNIGDPASNSSSTKKLRKAADTKVSVRNGGKLAADSTVLEMAWREAAAEERIQKAMLAGAEVKNRAHLAANSSATKELREAVVTRVAARNNWTPANTVETASTGKAGMAWRETAAARLGKKAIRQTLQSNSNNSDDRTVIWMETSEGFSQALKMFSCAARFAQATNRTLELLPTRPVHARLDTKNPTYIDDLVQLPSSLRSVPIRHLPFPSAQSPYHAPKGHAVLCGNIVIQKTRFRSFLQRTFTGAKWQKANVWPTCRPAPFASMVEEGRKTDTQTKHIEIISFHYGMCASAVPFVSKGQLRHGVQELRAKSAVLAGGSQIWAVHWRRCVGCENMYTISC